MSRTTIKSVEARQVYTLRGHPGVEAIVKTENGSVGRAVCTSGISIGTHEVAFQFDGGSKWKGKGVMGAVDNVNKIIGPALLGMDSANQLAADNTMLGLMPEAKLKLGGNAIAAVSAAVLKAGAASLDIPLYQHIGGASAMYLPVPGVNVVDGDMRYGGGITTSGGKPSHAVMCYGFDSFADASYACWDIYQYWTEAMQDKYNGSPNQYGNFNIPPGVFKCDEEIWELLAKTIIKAGYEGKAGLQIDVATDTYHNKDDDKYYGLFSDKPKTKDELFELYKHMVKTYPFIIIEDPFNEDDYETTAALTRELDIQIVGDDLFTTNPERVKYGISKGAANTVLLKVNQVGTITESLEMIQLAYKYGYGVMPCSSRGEGDAIADYCVGINAGSVRESGIGESGNRFLEIEKELGARAIFMGADGLMGKRFGKNN